MTKEEKARAYDEALERAKKFHTPDSNNSNLKAVLELIFPELTESEDERVIKIIKRQMCYDPEPVSDEERQLVETWLEKQKEQKPVEWSEEDKRMCQHIISDLREFRDCETDEELLSDYEDEITWLKSLPERFNLPIKQEWDDFDEDCLKRAIWYVENPAPLVVKDTNLALWLKSLPQRFNLQPKNEWSEEDEIERDSIIEYINSGNIYATSKVNMISWLKFLHPQPKQERSEEDERILKGIIGKIDHDQTYGVSKAEMLSFLESLRPSWKPTEEQIRILGYLAKSLDVASHERHVIDDMIDDLKKL